MDSRLIAIYSQFHGAKVPGDGGLWFKRNKWTNNAKNVIRQLNQISPTLRLIYFRKEFCISYEGLGYEILLDDEVDRLIRSVLGRAWFWKKKDPDSGWEKAGPVPDDKKHVGELRAALATICQVKAPEGKIPFWRIEDENQPDPDNLIVCTNGILNAVTRELRPPSSNLISFTNVGYDYDPNAKCPVWDQTCVYWFDDNDEIKLLEEMIGYTAVGDRDAHKMFLVLGPTRSGKGTIADVQEYLLGAGNIATAGLSSFDTERNKFGMESFINKKAAVMRDVLSGKRVPPVVIERLLQVIANDTLHIDRKWKGVVHEKLGVAVWAFGNEIPKLFDNNGALMARIIPLQMTKSFLGVENFDLRSKLRAECPGILNWCLGAYQRFLRNDRRFTIPESSKELMSAIEEQLSPFKVFCDECIEYTGDKLDWVAKEDVLDLADNYWRSREWKVEYGPKSDPYEKPEQHRMNCLKALSLDLRKVIPGLDMGGRNWKKGQPIKTYRKIKIKKVVIAAEYENGETPF